MKQDDDDSVSRSDCTKVEVLLATALLSADIKLFAHKTFTSRSRRTQFLQSTQGIKMTQTGPFNLIANPFLAWSSLMLTSSQMMFTSAQVIGQRISRMLLAGDTPTRSDQREIALMSEEKVAAAVESAQLMTQGMFKLGQDLAVMAGKQMLAGVPLMMSIAASATPRQSAERQTNLARAGLANAAQANSRIASAVPRIAHKSLAPIHAKATANRKRLAKHAANRH
jgi:hypothetical protein